jgi:2-amino-4-hydroxy-6-hydroxymethyldihydropteridine diphosphokinase/dihydropteroate synthase
MAKLVSKNSVEVYLGLGSNVGERVQNIEAALKELDLVFLPQSMKLACVYENAALLPEGAPTEWNLPFLNTVVSGQTNYSPEALLQKIKEIEVKVGRSKKYLKWSPRELDIDILFYGTKKISRKNIKIPHPEISKRSFVLDPLRDLAPSKKIATKKTLLELSRKHPSRLPVLMKILNVTPDSFSGDGILKTKEEVTKIFQAWPSSSFQILDLGAESTRPGASEVTAEEEWKRLEHVLASIEPFVKDRFLRPKISVDTRRAIVAERALRWGVDIINDVSGLADPQMVGVLKKYKCDYVLMHSLIVPANPQLYIDKKLNPTKEVLKFFKTKLAFLKRNQISPDRIILDPGIGFGKTAEQSFELMKDLDVFQKLGSRVLVGHSRKSFLATLSKAEAKDRDPQTLGVSFYLLKKGVDILRVHNTELHAKAFASWNALSS